MSADDGQHDPGGPKRLKAVVDLIEFAGRLRPSAAVVPGGHRVEDLRLVESARDHGIVDRIILVGDKERILAGVSEVGIEVPPEDIVAAADDEQAAAATVELIKAGAADIVLKGDISTPIINRHMLPLAVRSTVSLATVFDAAPLAHGRPMVMTDPGVTTVCNYGRMVDLVQNAVDVARVVGIDRPRVAVLSANEKQIPSLPSTRIGLRLAQRTWPHAVVCGPLSFDLATDPSSVAIKGLPDLPGADEVAGQADVLVCPGIDAANVLYKTVAAMNKYGQASLASVTVGFPVPYVILSRSDSLETRLVSIALCAVYARHRPPERTPNSVALSPPAGQPGEAMGLPTEDVNVVVAHLAATTKVAVVRGGKVVDTKAIAIEEEGLRGLGLGEVSAQHQVRALLDPVAKEIGGAFVMAGCDVDAIVLTSPLVGGKGICSHLRRRVSRLAPVMILEGPEDLSSLAADAVELLAGR